MVQWLLKTIIGTKNERDIKRIRPLVNRINELEVEYQQLSDEQLQAKTPEFRERLKQGETLDDILCEAFAVVKNACRRKMGDTFEVADHERTWVEIPYNVQLVGGICLHQGRIAEMATGEGKTLVATLPTYLNALEGKGVHVVTVNDYLARRDADWVGYLHSFLGLKVGCIQNQMSPAERREMYNCDITYGTNSEFGFDYLRDNMAYRPEDKVQRGHSFSIVDEIDSILIDEAKTPLIIAGAAPHSKTEHYNVLKPQVERLVRSQRKLCDRFMKEARQLLDEENDEEAMFKLYQVSQGMPKNKAMLEFMEDPSMRRMVEKVNNQMLTDMWKEKGRELREEMFFIIDEKGHDASLTDKGCEAMSPDDPETYVLPDIISALSELDGDETLSEADRHTKAQEIQRQHSERSDTIHAVDQLIRAYCVYEKDVAYVVQNNQVIIVDENTGRLMTGRRWSDGLHQAVEAKEMVKVEKENQTLATITIQNYFRMYDKLSGMTGTAETEADEFHEIYKLDVMVIPTNRPVRRVDFNDPIYKTQREKFNAVVEEISECHQHGQPVLVGTITVDASEMLSRMLRKANIPHNVLNAKHHEREAEIVTRAGQPGAVTIATNMAGRGTDIKLGEGVVHISPEVIDSQISLKDAVDGIPLREILSDRPCGLHVIGTERHESRRIDRQLRGRCARQGDPGSSRFYVSLEDDLMRLFGSERISSIMEKLGIEEGEVLEHSMLNKSIERAQRRVEQYNFSIRKRTLEYDDVMNTQREIVYGFRSDVLTGENTRDRLYEVMEDVVFSQAESFLLDEEEGLQHFLEWARTTFPVGAKAEAIEGDRKDPEVVGAYLAEQVKAAYELKSELEEPEPQKEMERHIILQTVDTHWQEYLRAMDSLRQGVGLVAYGQKNPLVEFKHEAYDMFADLMDKIKGEIVSRMFSYTTSMEALQSFMASMNQKAVHDEHHALGAGAPPQAQPDQPSKADAAVQDALARANPIRRDHPKVGRNEPCPCGSGKKYKKCCGAAE